ncbi:MAG: GIY-YIG nuclease family protein [Phycisphaerae bacterium]|nr:GIY-YIG nuclease family protein [Phycisphaerae bacterium]
MWYLYIVECRNKSLYTGITGNIERRFKKHQMGDGGHYTYCHRRKEFYIPKNLTINQMQKIENDKLNGGVGVRN